MLAVSRTQERLVWSDRTGVNRAMEHRHVAPVSNASPATSQTESARHRDLLLAVARHKDKAAFAELFEYFAPRIKSFLMKGGAAADAADELAQETMLTIWQRAESFDPAKASASTWIFTIARNKRIDALRKQVRPEYDPADPALVEDESPTAPEMITQAQETDTVAEAIKALPSEQADLLYKSFFEDKTHADIAKETKLPLGTVKSRIRIALDKLRADKNVKGLWS
jgi:RNA polymerase sigma factor (sigma-70 family)